MEAQDKFGNDLSRDLYNQLCEYGAKLKELGYKESRSKPNLFYHQHTGGVVYFMDMRGTGQVKLWQDDRPLFYWNIELTMENWAKRRMLKEEMERLLEHGVPSRLSFYAGLDGLNPHSGPDGYCRVCGENHKTDEWYCSVECEKKGRPRSFCECCETRLSWQEQINHHVSYYPEEIVTVCRSCHNKIHMDDDYFPELTPPDEDIERFYASPKRAYDDT